jgi:hypothetical protein
MWEYTKKEWLLKGEQLFGENMMGWRFVCPSCGNVQTMEDFRPYKAQGATPDDVRFNCIGRFSGAKGTLFSSGRPCDYTSGGFFNIAPVTVVDGDEIFYCFAFEEEENE